VGGGGGGGKRGGDAEGGRGVKRGVTESDREGHRTGWGQRQNNNPCHKMRTCMVYPTACIVPLFSGHILGRAGRDAWLHRVYLQC